ncbi:hypothetical protein [Kribbella pittospori]|uniref:hypothetical protein n=1 Tax=Kribbella pittospori TaxID=722689 RepID=UPI003B50511C
MHATLLLVAGVPVHVVADRLGHADPSITLRVYAHVIRRHAAGIADVFAAAADHIDEDQDDEDDGETRQRWCRVSRGVSKNSPGQSETPGHPPRDLGFCLRARRDSNPQPSDP